MAQKKGRKEGRRKEKNCETGMACIFMVGPNTQKAEA